MNMKTAIIRRSYPIILPMLVILLLMTTTATGQTNGGTNPNDIDPDALITSILKVEADQRAKVQTLTLEAVLVEGDREREGLVEKTRFSKKVYVKYLADTAWFHEEYLEFFEEGEKQSDQDCLKAGEKKRKKKAKRKSLDISYPMLKSFRPEERAKYKIEYKGVKPEPIEGMTCHHFRVDAIEGAETKINGDYYFEAEAFHLVRVDFTPSKMTSNLMFKMKKLDMSVTYHEGSGGIWLPKEFNIDGKGKIGFLFGISFSGTETYSNPVINDNLDDSLFEVSDD